MKKNRAAAGTDWHGCKITKPRGALKETCLYIIDDIKDIFKPFIVYLLFIHFGRGCFSLADLFRGVRRSNFNSFFEKKLSQRREDAQSPQRDL